jgi:putative NIF3 family GTP cyclohydrolase 1 type 2
MKITEIISKLEVYHAPLNLDRETWDGVKYGDPDKQCTGIAVTCWPSAAVIQKTAALGYNLLICHEPAFFEVADETGWLKNNTVYGAKTALLDKTGVVIYRDHDHVHNDKPDRIFSGLVKKLGWEKYMADDGLSLFSKIFVMPETSVREIAGHVALVMHINGIRIIGNPDMKVTKVGFSGHFLGGPMDKTLISRIDSDDCELVIPGEIIDWTLGEYIQDAVTLGKKRAVLNVGHFNLEEPGMEYMAEWLPDITGSEIPVRFIQSGNGFQWLSF